MDFDKEYLKQVQQMLSLKQLPYSESQFHIVSKSTWKAVQ